ncbi:MAG TPA: hypothetical protein PLL10_06130, partial [Elusimicrobiales bacterium]|nr:hypothetical protein [Elusimicrobiales bacterium]
MRTRFAKHTAASAIGLVLALTTLELALRLLGYASERKQGSPPQAEKSNAIVCVGDSLTYGI